MQYTHTHTHTQHKPTELEKKESQPLIQININHPIIYSLPTFAAFHWTEQVGADEEYILKGAESKLIKILTSTIFKFKA